MRRVEYSAEMTDWFSSLKQISKVLSQGVINQFDQLRSVRGQSDLRLPLPKHSLKTDMKTGEEKIKRY